MAGALVRHSCCLVLPREEREHLAEQLAVQLLQTAQHRQDADTRQQQQQQARPQQQQQQSSHLLTVTGMQLVACHTLGASFLLPVPEMHCSCCSSTWVLQPAAAGFFGCSPVRPGVWFSQQLLDIYTSLWKLGTSTTSFAEALSRTSVTVDTYAPPLDQLAKHLLPIDQRQGFAQPALVDGSLEHVLQVVKLSNLPSPHYCLQAPPFCLEAVAACERILAQHSSCGSPVWGA